MRMLRARGCWKGLRLLSGLSVHPSQSPRLHAIALAQSTATSLESSSPIRPIFSRTFATDASDSSVIAVKNDAEYVSALNLAQENKGVAVVYFTAKWCGPCRMVSPVIDQLSTKYDKATFLKVDIDEEKLQAIVSEERITSVPTFRCYKGGKVVDQLVGADVQSLKNKVALLCES